MAATGGSDCAVRSFRGFPLPLRETHPFQLERNTDQRRNAFTNSLFLPSIFGRIHDKGRSNEGRLSPRSHYILPWGFHCHDGDTSWGEGGGRGERSVYWAAPEGRVGETQEESGAPIGIQRPWPQTMASACPLLWRLVCFDERWARTGGKGRSSAEKLATRNRGEDIK